MDFIGIILIMPILAILAIYYSFRARRSFWCIRGRSCRLAPVLAFLASGAVHPWGNGAGRNGAELVWNIFERPKVRNFLIIRHNCGIIKARKILLEGYHLRSREIVYELYRRAGITNEAYAEKLGISRSALWDRLNTTKAKDMSVSTMSEMIAVLGYRVVVVRDSSKLPTGCFVVD